MRVFVPACFGLILAATGAMAQTFDCSFPRQGAHEWIRSRIVVVFDGPEVTVFDSLINQEEGGPIPATVQVNNDQRMTIRWKLRNVKTQLGYGPLLNYSLTYYKQRDTATANLSAPNVEVLNFIGVHPQRFIANGTCKPR